MNEPSPWQRLKTSLQASAGEVVFGMEDGTVSIFGLVFGTLLLVALGVGRARIGGRAIVRTVLETVSIGVVAALAGVAIGVFISNIFA